MTQDPYRPADRPRMQIRPLGGAMGCVGMILFSVLASVILTVLLNWVL